MPPQEKEFTPSSSTSSGEEARDTRHHGPPETHTTPPSLCSRAWSHLNENVRASILVEIELLILTFYAVSFPDFHCFASNQTGNTVFLILAIVVPEADGDMFFTANIGIALGFFLAAAWLTGQLGHIIGARRRYWLILCNLIQTCLVAAAAALQFAQHSPRNSGGTLAFDNGPPSASTLWAIGLLACAAGSQVVQARALRVTEITTAMATAAWVDLVIDRELLARSNRGRNRRAGFLGALVLGTLAGAFVFRRVGSPAALAVSAAGKLLVTGMYLFNPADRPVKEESPEDSA
ncbi:hypothetical protein C7999DRAFT_26996 [Corynascus novoguineensis]|uniref:DUF1275 domain protein n=1 Tax=Corynascus novoguineensis TaxID=1126955 RepID=A0AAN7HPG2_9PEZI|nr:hypothetical protein C7999DRAFT_26996 [Corynascus novoguineensis]